MGELDHVWQRFFVIVTVTFTLLLIFDTIVIFVFFTVSGITFATVSFSRAYVSSTIVTLTMGDAVAASKDFQQVHLQHSP